LFGDSKWKQSRNFVKGVKIMLEIIVKCGVLFIVFLWGLLLLALMSYGVYKAQKVPAKQTPVAQESVEAETNGLVIPVQLHQEPVVPDSVEMFARAATPEEALKLKVRNPGVLKVDFEGGLYKKIEVGLDGVVPGQNVEIPNSALYWLVNNERSLVILNRRMHAVYWLKGEGWRMVSDQTPPVLLGAPEKITDDKSLVDVLKKIK
jgi:hypothetical protein